MDGKWRYFRLDGQLHEMAVEYNEMFKQKRKQMWALVEELGAKHAYCNTRWGETTVEGVDDAGQDKLGWRPHKYDKKILIPDTRKNAPREQREAGKKWADRLNGLTIPSPRKLLIEIRADSDVMTPNPHGRGYLVRHAHLDKIGDSFFVCLPVGDRDTYKPVDGMTELKEWEYLKLKDERDSKKNVMAEAM